MKQNIKQLNEEINYLNQKIFLLNKELEKKNLIIIGLLKDKQNKSRIKSILSIT